MANIHLIRHAQSVANANQTISGAHDNSPLSELGRLQAKLAGKNAVEFKFDLIVSSPLLRARETAGIIAEALEYPPENILVIDSLHERDLGELDGKNYTKLPLYDSNHDDIEGHTPGLETLDAFFERANQALATIEQRPEQHILVVCHNGIGRMIKVAASNGQPSELYQQPRLSNAVIYTL
jgi:broad specificity phosphatase PhoE